MPRNTPRKEDFLRRELHPAPQGQATETRVVPDPEFAAVDNSRPTLPDETEDGLDAVTEEVRHQTEDFPTGAGRPDLDQGLDEPVEPEEAIENQGEFPSLDDQGDRSEPPKRRRKS